jgi:hypothetical protein
MTKTSAIPYFLFACLLCNVWVHGFVSKPLIALTRRANVNALAASTTKEDENKKLLEKARSLREEASQLEQELRDSPQTAKASASVVAPPPKITKLPDSLWTFSYRFSSQPKDDDNKDAIVLPNYSGKTTIRLLADGYSELVSQSDDSKIAIKKVWGWDEEYSREDEQQYLLFSMDVTFPKSDPKFPGQSERYYFQARIDRNTDQIELQEGTVTCKKDVSEKTNGRWGLFKVAGILTEFRYVGDFVAKPCSNEA